MFPDNYLAIVMEFKDIRNFIVKKGNAKAISKKELNKDYYKWVDKKNIPRDYDISLKERIDKPFTEGMLLVKNEDGYIKFDNRKLRYDKCIKKKNNYEFYVGPAHFDEKLVTNVASSTNKKLFEYFKDEGIKNFNDEEAYFANLVAITATLETKDGFSMIFKRSPHSKLKPDFWQGVGGHLDIDLRFFEKNKPTDYFMNSLDKAIITEIEEELNIKPDFVEPTGFIHSLSGSDFTYIAKTNKTVDEVLECFEEAKDKEDHSDLVKLKFDEIVDFLLTEKKIVPVCFGSLLLYLKRRDKKLYKKILSESRNMNIIQA